MANYLSKVEIGGVEALIKDSKAEKSISDINTKLESIVYAAANTDISDMLQNALNKGNTEIIGGPYKITKTITVPAHTVLNGNGCKLEAIINGGWAIVVGREENWDEATSIKTGVSNLSLDCTYTVSGINICQKGAYIDSVHVVNCLESGIAFGIRYGTSINPASSGDITVTNCSAYSPIANGKTYNYGVLINSLDCCVVNYRSVGAMHGLMVSDIAGGAYLINCHPYAYGTGFSSWPDSIGFELHAETTLTNCYADDYRYGMRIYNQANIMGNNFYLGQPLDFPAGATPYGIYTDNKILNLSIKNVVSRAGAYSVVANNQLNYSTYLSNCTFTVSRHGIAKDYFKLGDLGCIIPHAGNGYHISSSGDKQPRTVIIVPSAKLIQAGGFAHLTICCDHFILNDMILKPMNGKSAQISKHPQFIPLTESGAKSDASVKLTVYNSIDNTTSIVLSDPINCNYWNINVYADRGVYWLPDDIGNFIPDNSTIISSITYNSNGHT